MTRQRRWLRCFPVLGVCLLPVGPNAAAHLLPEAGAQRTLEAVRCSALFGCVLTHLDQCPLLGYSRHVYESLAIPRQCPLTGSDQKVDEPVHRLTVGHKHVILLLKDYDAMTSGNDFVQI